MEVTIPKRVKELYHWFPLRTLSVCLRTLERHGDSRFYRDEEQTPEHLLCELKHLFGSTIINDDDSAAGLYQGLKAAGRSSMRLVSAHILKAKKPTKSQNINFCSYQEIHSFYSTQTIFLLIRVTKCSTLLNQL